MTFFRAFPLHALPSHRISKPVSQVLDFIKKSVEEKAVEKKSALDELIKSEIEGLYEISGVNGLYDLLKHVMRMSYEQYRFIADMLLKQIVIKLWNSPLDCQLSHYNKSHAPIFYTDQAGWVNFLVARGVNYNLLDQDGFSPLMRHAQLGSSETLSALLALGAAHAILKKIRPDVFESAFSLALTRGHRDCVLLLLNENNLNITHLMDYYDGSRMHYGVNALTVCELQGDMFLLGKLRERLEASVLKNERGGNHEKTIKSKP